MDSSSVTLFRKSVAIKFFSFVGENLANIATEARQEIGRDNSQRTSATTCESYHMRKAVFDAAQIVASGQSALEIKPIAIKI